MCNLHPCHQDYSVDMPVIPALEWLMREAVWHQLAKSFCLLDCEVPHPWWVPFGGINKGYRNICTSWLVPYSFSPDCLVPYLLIFLLSGHQQTSQVIEHCFKSVCISQSEGQVHLPKSIGRMPSHYSQGQSWVGLRTLESISGLYLSGWPICEQSLASFFLLHQLDIRAPTLPHSHRNHCWMTIYPSVFEGLE